MDFRRRKEFNIKTWMLTNYLEGKEEQVPGWVSRNNSQKNRELTNSCQYLWGRNWIYEFRIHFKSRDPGGWKPKWKPAAAVTTITDYRHVKLVIEHRNVILFVLQICTTHMPAKTGKMWPENVDSNWWTLFCLQNYGRKEVQKVDFLTFQLLKQERELNEDCRGQSRVPISVVHTV